MLLNKLNSELFAGLRRPAKGLLLFGPPGIHYSLLTAISNNSQSSMKKYAQYMSEIQTFVCLDSIHVWSDFKHILKKTCVWKPNCLKPEQLLSVWLKSVQVRISEAHCIAEKFLSDVREISGNLPDNKTVWNINVLTVILKPVFTCLVICT